ncbi:MAG: serine acetyltransferase [Desulfobacterales bacterium]|nr:serine acetyltransferase [Desulfobacterales bacterium]MDD4072775.1 serine acetyltransferase [Desulfobacterales bacterium]MDD4391361.1 serine acetyltransferase [Desulfobacterales bacterium]
MNQEYDFEMICKSEAESVEQFRRQIPGVATGIVKSFHASGTFTHIDYEPIPSRATVIDIIVRLRELLFPGYFTGKKLDAHNLSCMTEQSVFRLADMIAEQITLSFRHDCFRYHRPCIRCIEKGHAITVAFLKSIPAIREILATDVRATYEGDPAAQSYDDIIFSYPGLLAVTVYRLAHSLFELEVPILPRIMAEYAHSITGIDIHPGADIGARFVIDHGTGVVIGETTRIGNNVRIYQGVTLGALSLPKDAGAHLRGKKRHPSIENDVIIYAGATILGGQTVIGAGAVVGGNVWITESIPPGTTVVMDAPRLIYK